MEGAPARHHPGDALQRGDARPRPGRERGAPRWRRARGDGLDGRDARHAPPRDVRAPRSRQRRGEGEPRDHPGEAGPVLGPSRKRGRHAASRHLPPDRRGPLPAPGPPLPPLRRRRPTLGRGDVQGPDARARPGDQGPEHPRLDQSGEGGVPPAVGAAVAHPPSQGNRLTRKARRNYRSAEDCFSGRGGRTGTPHLAIHTLKRKIFGSALPPASRRGLSWSSACSQCSLRVLRADQFGPAPRAPQSRSLRVRYLDTPLRVRRRTLRTPRFRSRSDHLSRCDAHPGASITYMSSVRTPLAGVLSFLALTACAADAPKSTVSGGEVAAAPAPAESTTLDSAATATRPEARRV